MKCDECGTEMVWSYIFGKREWEEQLNVYAFLARVNGSSVNELSILAFFYDWDENSMLRNPDYPKHPILKIPVVLWDPEKQREFVMERINAHIACEPCSPEERWRRPSTFAVMKEGRKTALRVLGSYDEAYQWCNENGHIYQDGDFVGQERKGISIVERVGEDRRCQDYCPVRAICPENIYNRKEVEHANRED